MLLSYRFGRTPKFWLPLVLRAQPPYGMSWQDESNPALLQVLATRAKKIQLSCQLRTTRRKPLNYNKFLFTITAEIHARLLVNFYCQYAHRHMNLKIIRPVSERERAIRQFVIVKLTVSFLCVCPVIDHKFRHHIVNIVKVAVDPRGESRVDPQTTLTLLWRNSLSITGQTH